MHHAPQGPRRHFPSRKLHRQKNQIFRDSSSQIMRDVAGIAFKRILGQRTERTVKLNERIVTRHVRLFPFPFTSMKRSLNQFFSNLCLRHMRQLACGTVNLNAEFSEQNAYRSFMNGLLVFFRTENMAAPFVFCE
jgi:hypothetical protein